MEVSTDETYVIPATSLQSTVATTQQRMVATSDSAAREASPPPVISLADTAPDAALVQKVQTMTVLTSASTVAARARVERAATAGSRRQTSEPLHVAY